MRYVYIALLVVVAAVLLTFKLQNLDAVTVSLFSMALTLPLSLLLLLLLVYLTGMVTGGLVVGPLRTWMRRAKAA